MSHNNQKKIALINDFSGFGRCSLTVALPIISAMKIQCCPIPTSIFSNHSGYDSFYFEDFTARMQQYIDEWKKLKLEFSGICTGFLGSEEQIDIVTEFIAAFGKKDTIVVVDPVMGDNGVAYATYTDGMCKRMKELSALADIVTPNLTEACILAEKEYREDYSLSKIEEIAKIICERGSKKVVISGILKGQYMSNFCYSSDGGATIIKTKKIGAQRAGTGDVFSSIIAADAVNGVPFEASVRKASNFVKKCIAKSEEMKIPTEDGVVFEEFLCKLK